MRLLAVLITVVLQTCLVATMTTSVMAAPVDTVFQLDPQSSEPLVARHEKARGLLRAWEFVAPEFTMQFRLNEVQDVTKIHRALANLLQEQGTITTAPAVSDAARHYLVYSVARAQMVNSIDFSPEKLRHFFELNAAHYPCAPRATVSELLVPKTYTDAAGTTAILDEILGRLDKETFPRVAYQINDRMGNHGTGYLGELNADKVGPERFALYQQVSEQGEHIGGSGDPVGGPFDTPAGWLFIQVHSFVGDKADCFDTMKERVAQDYGREWLKRIEADTLTTAAQELKPEVTAYTTGTALESRAFLVGDHAMTFHDARAALPFLMGDVRDARFWQSIQRQALELELIYHSSTGKAVRELPEYGALEGSLRLLAAKHGELAGKQKDGVTTAALQAWYENNHARYDTFGDVSYTEFECGSIIAGASSPSDHARYAAVLESLKAGTESGEDELSVKDRWSTSPVAQVGGVPVKRDVVTSVTFVKLSREKQVAMQDLDVGQWSAVFTEDGQQKIIRVDGLERTRPLFDEIADRIAADFWFEYQLNFWGEVAGGPGVD